MSLPIGEFKDRLRIALDNAARRPVDMANATGISRSSISQYLSGYAKPNDINTYKMAKYLGVTEAWLLGFDATMQKPNTKQINIPIVGEVACGLPIFAEQNIIGYAPVDKKDNVDFALYAHGDSMTAAKISDGDLLYIRQQPTVENGEIALVLVNDQATVKRFHDYGDFIELRPDSFNPEHKDQRYEKKDNSIAVQGKVVFIKAYIK